MSVGLRGVLSNVVNLTACNAAQFVSNTAFNTSIGSHTTSIAGLLASNLVQMGSNAVFVACNAAQYTSNTAFNTNIGSLSNVSYSNFSNLFPFITSNTNNIACNYMYLSNLAIKSGSFVSFPPLTMTAYCNTFTPAAVAASGGVAGYYQTSTNTTTGGNYFPWHTFNLTNSSSDGGWATNVGNYLSNGTCAYTGSNPGSNGGGYTNVSGTSVGGDWLQLVLPAAYAITAYTIESSAQYASYCPSGWVLAGSLDGSTWSLIDTRSGQTSLAAAANSTRSYTGSSTAWQYLRFIVTNIAPNANEFGVIGSIVFNSTVLAGTSFVSPSLTTPVIGGGAINCIQSGVNVSATSGTNYPTTVPFKPVFNYAPSVTVTPMFANAPVWINAMSSNSFTVNCTNPSIAFSWIAMA